MHTLKTILFLSILCGHAAFAASLEVEIGSRLSALSEAKTLEEIDAAIQEAQDYLNDHRTDSSKVTIGFLDADIDQAHGRACTNLWLAEKTNQAAYDKAVELLKSTMARYERLSEQADTSADRLAEGLRGSAQRSSRWREFAGYPSRANYSRAWSYYTLGLLNSPEGGFSQAIELFGPFVRGGYRDNRIVQDCFLGYALCLYEMGRLTDAGALMNERRIRPDNTPANVLKQVTLLRMRIAEKQNTFIGVELAGQLYFQTRPQEAGDFDRVEVEIMLKRIEALANLTASPDNPTADSYRQKLSACRRQLAERSPQWNANVTGILEASGVDTALGYLRRAKDAFEKGEFVGALNYIEQGLVIVDEKLETEAGIDLQYLKCLCLNELARPQEAVQSSRLFLRHYPKDARVQKVSQIGMESAIQLAKSDEQLTVDEFETFAAVYAGEKDDTETQAMLRWYRASFDAACGRFAEAHKQLELLSPEQPGYGRALYLRCFAAYQQHRQSPDERQSLERAFGTVVEFGQIADTESTEVWVCEAMFDLAVAIMADCVRTKAEISEPVAFIEAVEKLNCLDTESRSPWLAAKLPFLAVYGDIETLRQLLRQAKQQPCDEALCEAFLAAAEILMLSEKTEAETAKASLAAEIFSHLLKYYEKDNDRKTQHSRILWKLAESLRRAGRFEKAIQRYQEILKNDAPKVPVHTVRSLAVSYQAVEQYEQAAANWRKMTRLAPKTSPGWYEAHYELIHCWQLAGDSEKVRQLWAYFQLKHPEPLPAEWSAKFQQFNGEAAP